MSEDLEKQYINLIQGVLGIPCPSGNANDYSKLDQLIAIYAEVLDLKKAVSVAASALSDYR